MNYLFIKSYVTFKFFYRVPWLIEKYIFLYIYIYICIYITSIDLKKILYILYNYTFFNSLSINLFLCLEKSCSLKQVWICNVLLHDNTRKYILQFLKGFNKIFFFKLL